MRGRKWLKATPKVDELGLDGALLRAKRPPIAVAGRKEIAIGGLPSLRADVNQLGE